MLHSPVGGMPQTIIQKPTGAQPILGGLPDLPSLTMVKYEEMLRTSGKGKHSGLQGKQA